MKRDPYGFGSRFEDDRIALVLQAVVVGLGEARFQEIALAAKRECPLSVALAGVAEITLTATLLAQGAAADMTGSRDHPMS